MQGSSRGFKPIISIPIVVHPSPSLGPSPTPVVISSIQSSSVYGSHANQSLQLSSSLEGVLQQSKKIIQSQAMNLINSKNNIT